MKPASVDPFAEWVEALDEKDRVTPRPLKHREIVASVAEAVARSLSEWDRGHACDASEWVERVVEDSLGRDAAA